MTFTTTNLLDGGVLVEGTDAKGTDGSTVLRSERWSAVLALRTGRLAMDEFNAAVKEFFAPLTEAADRANAIADTSQGWDTVTIGEKVEGVEPEVIKLDADGILLRLLDEGQHDKLRWVGGTLVALS